MKRLIFTTIILASALLTVASCSVTSTESQPQLTPLPTTGISNPSSTTIPYITQQELDDIMSNLKDKDYIVEVEHWYGSDYIPMSNETLIDFGHLWCEVLEAGMTPFDVQSRINEGAIDEQDALLHESIVKAAVFHYCPDQQYKWESSN